MQVNPGAMREDEPDPRYRRIIEATALFDLFVMSGFALPGISNWLLARLRDLHAAVPCTGTLSTFDSSHLLFVNLAGIITVVWAVLRLRHPHPILGLYDAFMKVPIGLTIASYVLIWRISALFSIFVLTEAIGAGLLLTGYFATGRRRRRAMPAGAEPT